MVRKETYSEKKKRVEGKKIVKERKKINKSGQINFKDKKRK